MASTSVTINAANVAAVIQTDAPVGAPGAGPGSAGVNLVSSSFVGTILFEASTDGATFFAVAAHPILAAGILGEQIAGQRAEVRELRRRLDEMAKPGMTND